ncbi:MAG: hypothetical protein ACE5H9_01905 [Anaerolineae bacterium]
MKQQRQQPRPSQTTQPEKKLPEYERPAVITYTEKQILEQLGPAMAGSPGGDSVFPGGAGFPYNP